MLERTTALSVQDVKMCRKSIPECVSALARSVLYSVMCLIVEKELKKCIFIR